MWLDNDENTAVEDVFARTAEETTCGWTTMRILQWRTCSRGQPKRQLVLHSPSTASQVLDRSEGNCEREYKYG